MTRDGVAEWLGIKRELVALWAFRGVGPPYSRPTNGITLYRKSDVEAWLEQNMHTPTRRNGRPAADPLDFGAPIPVDEIPPEP